MQHLTRFALRHPGVRRLDEFITRFGHPSGVAILGAMLADLIVLPALVGCIAKLQERSVAAKRLWRT